MNSFIHSFILQPSEWFFPKHNVNEFSNMAFLITMKTLSNGSYSSNVKEEDPEA